MHSLSFHIGYARNADQNSIQCRMKKAIIDFIEYMEIFFKNLYTKFRWRVITSNKMGSSSFCLTLENFKFKTGYKLYKFRIKFITSSSSKENLHN